MADFFAREIKTPSFSFKNAFLNRIAANLGIILTLFLALLPAFFWFISSPVKGKFGDVSSIFTSIGQITGLIGMAMMALTIILSSRPIFLDNFFYGLNNLYKMHRLLGITAFFLLLIHPLSFVTSYLVFSSYSAALFLLPSSDWSKNFGLIALLMMMLLMTVTILAKTRYQILKFFHKMFGLVFIFSVLHTFLTQSDFSRSPLIHWYLLILNALGLAAFSYKTLFERFLIKKCVYFVKTVNLLISGSMEITMTPKEKPIKYYPGQFIFINFRDSNLGSESHPFSISSSPGETELKILVKNLGDYTLKLKNLAVGSIAEVEGPFGKLSYLKIPNKNQIWVAGGVGISPFLGMARDLKNSNSKYKIHLFYCAASRKDLVYAEELAQIASFVPGFNFIPFCQDENGFLDTEKIKETSGVLSGHDILLCGPPAMLKNLKIQFKKIMIPSHRIHSEEFNLL